MPRKYNIKNKKHKLKEMSEKFDTLINKFNICESKKTKKKIIDEILANRLNFARTVNKYTLKDLSHPIGCKYQQVAKFIKSENSLNASQLILLCLELDISLKWILKGFEKNKGGINDNKTNR